MGVDYVEAAYPVQIPAINGKLGEDVTFWSHPGWLHQSNLMTECYLRLSYSANAVLQSAKASDFSDVKYLQYFLLQLPISLIRERVAFLHERALEINP